MPPPLPPTPQNIISLRGVRNNVFATDLEWALNSMTDVFIRRGGNVAGQTENKVM
jgi:hypothetical protein